MLQFRNITDQPVSLYKPHGDPLGLLVEAGQTVSVDGQLAAAQPHDDAWVVGEGERATAWPKASWDLVQDEKPRPQARGADKE